MFYAGNAAAAAAAAACTRGRSMMFALLGRCVSLGGERGSGRRQTVACVLSGVTQSTWKKEVCVVCACVWSDYALVGLESHFEGKALPAGRH